VYELARGSRGIDAVKCAGGLKAEASPDAVNLAAELSDGSQLRLPTKKEAKRSAQQAEGAVASGGQSSSSSEAGAAINLNSADAAALQTLPGIGPVTAEKIIAEREKSGAFTSLDDLQRVAGIGQKRVEALRGLADVR
jgi:competence protein ComEA